MLLTFNRQMRVFGVTQMDLQWDYGGTIIAEMQIGAIPLVTDSASTRCSSSVACELHAAQSVVSCRLACMLLVVSSLACPVRE